MSTAALVAIVVAVALVVACFVVWARDSHPEDAASHSRGEDDSGDATGTSDRPAGPGAEDEYVADAGETGPGPPP